ncbi:MAG: 50S ribosomal protein L13 [Bdellovibrionales bacterium]|nr:50S ribosomal protein L13 [Bdellovibrionales bacterium]
MTTSFLSKKAAADNKKWHVIDATNIPLGRLASEAASLLRGKNKTNFTPHVDCGDFVIILNAPKIKLTGSKLDKKLYRHHSGYIGGLKTETARDRLARVPEKMIADAVWGMLPKGSLGRKILKNLKVYAGSDHPHSAQAPEEYKLKYVEAA